MYKKKLADQVEETKKQVRQKTQSQMETYLKKRIRGRKNYKLQKLDTIAEDSDDADPKTQGNNLE